MLDLRVLYDELVSVVDWRERTKNSYFWTPDSSASLRRNFERNNNKSFSFDYKGDHYYVRQHASMSCKHVYTSLTVKKNGEIKDVRALKKIIKDIEKDMACLEKAV